MLDQLRHSAAMCSIFCALIRVGVRRSVCACVCMLVGSLSLVWAQGPQHMPEQTELEISCELLMSRDPHLPDYYCDCTHSVPFYYGIDTVLTDSTWFKATMNDVNAGLSAYWFSSSSITAKAYILCSQQEETLSFHIGKNGSYSLDMQELNQKIAASSTGQALSSITLKMLCVPDSGSGRFICNPYGRSAVTSCSEPLPFYVGPKYTVGGTSLILAYDGTMYKYYRTMMRALRWVGDKNASVDVTVRRGSCTGPVVASRTMQDSTRLWMLDNALLQSIYQAGDTLFFHLSSTGSGVLRMLSSFTTENIPIDTTLCQGMEFVLGDSAYVLPTVVRDSVYDGVEKKLTVTSYNIQFAAPSVEYDTIRCHYDSLGFLYMGDRSKKVDRYGDYTFLVERVGQCSRDIRLHVEQLWYERSAEVDSTVCQGMRIKLPNNVTYSKDTTVTLVSSTQDSRITTTYSLHFTVPEMEYDTICCYRDTFPFVITYAAYNNKKITITKAGTYTVTLTKVNTCTRKIQIKVIEKWDLARVTKDTTLCQGMVFEANGNTYTAPATVGVTTIQPDNRTKLITTYRVHFTAPVLEYDTIGVHQEMMPYFYEGCAISAFGDTTVALTKSGECDRSVALHVEELVTPITYQTAEVDTTLCEGRGLALADTVYYAAGNYVDSSYVSAYVVQITTYHLFITPKPVEYDTMLVMDEDLPVIYHDSTYTLRGSYVNEVMENGCLTEYRLLLAELPMQQVYDTIRQEICHGKVWEVADTALWESGAFTRTQRIAKDTTLYTTYVLTVSPAPVLTDTIEAYADSLPFVYEEQQIAFFGSHTLYITRANECDEEVHLEVLELLRDTIPAAPDTLPEQVGLREENAVAPQVRKVWLNGTIYIEKNGVRYTLLGLKAEQVAVPQNDK